MMAAIRNQNAQPNYNPNLQPDAPRIIRRRVEKKRRKSFYTIKALLIVCGIGVFSLMFIELYTASQINHVHYEIQSVQRTINQQLIRNEELSARVSVLSQHSRIIQIAEEHGLTLTPNENIVNIQR